MKISDIRASLQRLAERLDNQWAYARSDAEMDIAAVSYTHLTLPTTSRV